MPLEPMSLWKAHGKLHEKTTLLPSCPLESQCWLWVTAILTPRHGWAVTPSPSLLRNHSCSLKLLHPVPQMFRNPWATGEYILNDRKMFSYAGQKTVNSATMLYF